MSANAAKKMMIWATLPNGFLRLLFSRANCHGTSSIDALPASSGFALAAGPPSALATPSCCAPQYKHLSLPLGTSCPHSEHCSVTTFAPFPFFISLSVLACWKAGTSCRHSHGDVMKKRLWIMIGENYQKVKYLNYFQKEAS